MERAKANMLRVLLLLGTAAPLFGFPTYADPFEVGPALLPPAASCVVTLFQDAALDNYGEVATAAYVPPAACPPPWSSGHAPCELVGARPAAMPATAVTAGCARAVAAAGSAQTVVRALRARPCS